MKLEFIGMDKWDNSVYKDEDEKFWKDLGYRTNEPNLYATDAFDGDPGRSIFDIEKYKNVEIEFSPSRATRHPRASDYQMLGRLMSDCEYYLGWGNKNQNRLWTHSEKDHIEKMKSIWNSFPDDEKPEWLTLEQISKYESEMMIQGETIK